MSAPSKMMRGLIERIVLTPAEGVIFAELTCDLTAILDTRDAKKPKTNTQSV